MRQHFEVDRLGVSGVTARRERGSEFWSRIQRVECSVFQADPSGFESHLLYQFLGSSFRKFLLKYSEVAKRNGISLLMKLPGVRIPPSEPV